MNAQELKDKVLAARSAKEDEVFIRELASVTGMNLMKLWAKVKVDPKCSKRNGQWFIPYTVAAEYVNSFEKMEKQAAEAKIAADKAKAEKAAKAAETKTEAPEAPETEEAAPEA